MINIKLKRSCSQKYISHVCTDFRILRTCTKEYCNKIFVKNLEQGTRRRKENLKRRTRYIEQYPITRITSNSNHEIILRQSDRSQEPRSIDVTIRVTRCNL